MGRRRGKQRGKAQAEAPGAGQVELPGPGVPTGLAVDSLGVPVCHDLSAVDKNRRKGTAKLTVKVTGPGKLKLAKTESVQSDKTTAKAAGRARLSVRPRRKARRKLNRTGSAG